MPFVGTGHIWLIGILLIVVLIIWGPGKLPDVGSGMGRAIREFRKASTEARDEFAKVTRPEAPVEQPGAASYPATPATAVPLAPPPPPPAVADSPNGSAGAVGAGRVGQA